MNDRFGALTERNFRFVFSSTTISAFGDGVSTVALAFAVLKISHNSATAVGLVIAARQLAAAAITLAAGVFADRLPRHLVLVVAALVQGTMQLVTGALVLSGRATVPTIAVLALAYGLADGFVIPTSQGLIPTIVSAVRLQQANALLGLSRSVLGLLGPSLGGILTGLGSPGAALEVDAATFFAAAVLLLRVTIQPRDDTVEPERFFDELRAGWAEFRRQTWIWTTIVFFGIGNFAGSAYGVLGPKIAEEDYGGAVAWGFVGGAFGLGAIVGGFLALRFKPRRLLLASCIAAVPWALPTIALGLRVPLAVLLAVSVVAGIGIAMHLAFWFTVFQQQVPEAARSRVSSYDALGSFVLIPLGSAIAGPIAALAGISATLIGAGLIAIACNAVILAQPSVWSVERLPETAAA